MHEEKRTVTGGKWRVENTRDSRPETEGVRPWGCISTHGDTLASKVMVSHVKQKKARTEEDNAQH